MGACGKCGAGSRLTGAQTYEDGKGWMQFTCHNGHTVTERDDVVPDEPEPMPEDRRQAISWAMRKSWANKTAAQQMSQIERLRKRHGRGSESWGG